MAWDWQDIFGIGVQLFNTGVNIVQGAADRDAASDAAAAGRAAGIAAADIRATLTAESAALQATLLEAQGDYYEKVGEFNARIYDQQAEVSIDLAERETAIIGYNAQVQQTIRKRQFSKVQSQVVAAVGSSGIELEGSPIYVLLNNAAEADYEFSVRDWSTQIAKENRTLQGDLDAWTANSNASRERYMGQLLKALKYNEAALTRDFGERAAEAEREAAAL